MRQQEFITQAAAFAILAGMLAGCSRDPSQGPSGAPIPQVRKDVPVPVTVATVIQKDVPLELEIIGAARAYASVSVKARVDGQLTRVAFKQGDEVKRGDLIFEIDKRPFQAALSQAEAVLARDVASFENAEADRRRTDELAATKAVAATQVDANRAKAAALRASVEADKAAVETARLQLSFCSITSSVNGRMGLSLVDEGNIVKNNDTILAVVNQTKPLYADFAVAERFLPNVRAAAARGHLRVAATPPQHPEARSAGTLEVINNQVDTATGTVMLRAVFPNTDEQLWPGQFLNVTLTLGQLTNVTVVPAQAVQTSQSGEFVFVVTADSRVEKRLVKLGPILENEAVIESGVQPGETVVTDGQMRLAPGFKADIKTPGATSSPKPGPGKSS
ncbi:MAG: efflux RND transporter periplasmic adaptor subunit [Verrucomicrobia bacterium]|jgi:multidrug efflux system membrane fusion protein|nr:efflux RND transporter periplasmic adaptor subunit [Verrucomicrobiota bacterium]